MKKYVVRNLRTGIILPKTIKGIDFEDALDLAYRLVSADIRTEVIEMKES